MDRRATLALGLVSGAATALVLLVAAVLLIPPPTASVVSASPSPSASQGAGGSSGAVASGGSGAIAASIVDPHSHIGDPAPPLGVPQLGGGTIDLTKLAGRPVWVEFLRSTCAGCRDELAAMNGFATRYADLGLVILVIDVGEGEGTIAAFAESLNLRFPIGLDGNGSAAAAWDATSLPVHFWIDRDGVVRARATGPLTAAAMAENLRVILPGVSVSPS